MPEARTPAREPATDPRAAPGAPPILRTLFGLGLLVLSRIVAQQDAKEQLAWLAEEQLRWPVEPLRTSASSRCPCPTRARPRARPRARTRLDGPHLDVRILVV